MILGERYGAAADPRLRGITSPSAPPQAQPAPTSRGVSAPRSADDARLQATGSYNSTPRPIPAKPTDYAVSPALLAALNQAGWKTPTPAQPVGMPADSFVSEGIRELQGHSYAPNTREWEFLKQYAATPEGQAQGFGLPFDYTIKDDEWVSPADPRTRTPVIMEDVVEVAPLTDEAYQALTPDQKAAVDFNTMLVSAREKDFANEWKPRTDQERIDYENKVRGIFGVGGGSNMLAPNVIDLLTKVKFSAVGQDLDEFLSLDRAIDSSELKDFKLSTGDIKSLANLELDMSAPSEKEQKLEAVNELAVNDPSSYAWHNLGGRARAEAEAMPDMLNAAGQEYLPARSIANMGLIDSSAISGLRDYLTTLAQGTTPLWGFDALQSVAFSPTGTFAPNSSEVPFGFGNPELRGDDPYSNGMDQFFQNLYSAASDPSIDGAARIEEEIAQTLDTPEEVQAWLQYVDLRTRMEMQYGSAANPSVLNPLTPEDMRKLAGLED